MTHTIDGPSAPAPFTQRHKNAPADDPTNWALYDQYLDLCEAHRWKMADVRAEIATVDPKTLTENDRKVIDCVGEVAVVEGNAPSIVVNQLALMLYDSEYASFATYQVGEEAKHFHSIRHYCRHVGHPIAARHGEAAVSERQKGFDPSDFGDAYACVLINLLGETLNIHLYQVLAENCDEPVLKKLLNRIALDERRHQQWFAMFFEKRAAADPAYVPSALESLRAMLGLDRRPEAREQRHQGTGVVNYIEATEKVIRYGYSLDIIARTVREQWQLIERCFGDALDIPRHAFYEHQIPKR